LILLHHYLLENLLDLSFHLRPMLHHLHYLHKKELELQVGQVLHLDFLAADLLEDYFLNLQQLQDLLQNPHHLLILQDHLYEFQ
jgi:hypothetical protein